MLCSDSKNFNRGKVPTDTNGHTTSTLFAFLQIQTPVVNYCINLHFTS